MDRFQEMTVFLAAAEEQSFAAAARRLNMSPPTVTRAVAGLEKRIGALLLTRTTRSVRLTEAGERYVEDCRRILAELEEADDSAAGSHATARGELAITAPVLFGEMFVTPVILDYLDAQPDVTVRALLADRVVSMADEGIDVAIRIGELQDSGLHAVHAGNVRRVVCAAPEFLHRYGAPQHPDQLTAYRVVAASAVTQTAEWRFVEARATVSVRIRARLSVTSNKAAIVAAGRGWGLTRVLSYQIAPQLASGALVIVLEDYEPAPLPIHVVYQHGRNLPARVRSFVDFCVARLRADPALKAAESG